MVVERDALARARDLLRDPARDDELEDAAVRVRARLAAWFGAHTASTAPTLLATPSRTRRRP